MADGDWVAEGRDIGTVVAPDAAVKVFLTASARSARAAARPSIGADPATVLAEQASATSATPPARHSPLRAAPDAVSSTPRARTSSEVVDEIAGLVASRAS